MVIKISPYFCIHCGEEEEFRVKWTRDVTQEIEGDMDKFGEIRNQDVVDEYTNEDSSYEYTCDNCDEDVEDISEKEIAEAKILHTQKDGKWSEDELDEEEQNEEFKAKIYAEQL